MSFFGYLSSHPLYLSVALVSIAVVIVFAIVKYPTSKLLFKIIARFDGAEKSVATPKTLSGKEKVADSSSEDSEKSSKETDE